MKKLTALLSAGIMAVSLVSTAVIASADELSEDVIDTTKDYHYEKYTFEELLAMSDEEFIELDTYFGDIPEKDWGPLRQYRCIYKILIGSGAYLNHSYYDGDFPYTEEISWDIGTEKKYYVYNGTTDEELDAFYEHIYSVDSSAIQFAKGNYPLNAIFPTSNHDKATEDEISGLYIGISTIRPTFLLANYDEEGVEFEPESFEADMNEIFGGAVGYKVWEEKNNIFVKFDVAECNEINQENVLYFAKLYYGLTSINPYFTYKNEYILGSEEAEPSFTNTTTTTTTTTTITETEATDTTTTTVSATTTASAATTTKKESSESPKTGDTGLTGVILAGAGAVAMAFALRKREE